MSNKVLNKRSSVVVDGEPKLPTPQQLDYGEIAINFADGYETMSIKNDEDEIVKFSSDRYWQQIIEEDEYINATALNELNRRFGNYATSSDTHNAIDTIVSNFGMYATSSDTYSAINELESVVEEDERVTAAALNDLNDKINLCKDVIEEDERVTAAALNDLNVRVSGCATVADVIENELVTAEALNYLYDEVDGMWYELGRYATSSNVHSTISRYATSASVHTAIKGIDTKLGNYATSANTHNAINWLKTELEDDEYVIATALTDLNEKISGLSETVEILSGQSPASFTETDPTVPAWAKESTKPSYTLDEVSDGSTRKLSNYATSANVHARINAVDSKFGNYATSSSTYTAIKAVDTKLGTYATSANVHNRINAVDAKFNSYALSSYTHSAIDAINQKLTNIYSYKGSKTNYSDLPSNGNTIGDVWNVVNANGQIGESGYTPAGTNYAWTGTEWDALGGSIDLSNYVENETLDNYTTKAEASEYAAAALANAKSYSNTLSGNVVSTLSNYSTSASTYNAINAVNVALTAHTASTNIHLTSGDVKSQIEAYNYLTGYTETDPTVPSWAKADNKPSYTLDEVSDGSTRKLSDYAKSANVHTRINTVNNALTAHTANTSIHLSTGDVKSQIEAYNYISAYTETDPTVPAWAKETNKPSYTLDEVSDGSTRKLSSYATSAAVHTRINTVNNALTAHTADTTIHVTSSDKSTWNGKQNAINDLTTIRNNASSGATAYNTVTAHTADTAIHVTSSDKTTWNGKQDSISDLSTIRNNASSGASAYTYMVTGATAAGTNLSVTNKIVAIPSASSSTFGVVKIGDFLTSTNGVVSVSTGSTNTTVARGNHSHSSYATTGNLTTLSSQTETHINSSALHLPTVSSSDNGKILMVSGGTWQLVTPSVIYAGNSVPENVLGNNGDIYLQTQ